MPKNCVEGIKAYCPVCICEPEKIELWNCGPIIRLRCPRCGVGISESEINKQEGTVEGLIRLWNEKGLYLVMDE